MAGTTTDSGRLQDYRMLLDGGGFSVIGGVAMGFFLWFSRYGPLTGYDHLFI